LLHDARRKHTLPVLKLQPLQLELQHGVDVREQDPLSLHASHKQQKQQPQERPSPHGARSAGAGAPLLADTATLDQDNLRSRWAAGTASLVVRSLERHSRDLAVHTHHMEPVGRTQEPSVARRKELAVTDHSYMKEHRNRRTTTGRGARGARDGAT